MQLRVSRIDLGRTELDGLLLHTHGIQQRDVYEANEASETKKNKLDKEGQVSEDIRYLSIEYLVKTKDVLLNRIEHGYIFCDTDLVING